MMQVADKRDIAGSMYLATSGSTNITTREQMMTKEQPGTSGIKARTIPGSSRLTADVPSDLPKTLPFLGWRGKGLSCPGQFPAAFGGGVDDHHFAKHHVPTFSHIEEAALMVRVAANQQIAQPIKQQTHYTCRSSWLKQETVFWDKN